MSLYKTLNLSYCSERIISYSIWIWRTIKSACNRRSYIAKGKG